MINNIRSRLRKEYSNNKALVYDVVFLAVLYIITLIVFIKLDATERLYEFSRTHEDMDLDEILIALALFSFFYLLIFLTRRFFELRQTIIKANTDPLIGIFNRRKGSELILDEICNIKRNNRKAAIIMFDIDNFKIINDTFGHNYGDYVLKEFISILNTQIRESDYIIRWGGEEFLILCTKSDINGAFNLAERYRKRIESHRFKKNDVQITASFGVVELNTDEDLRTQIETVDKLLYISKKKTVKKI